jgi:hypothetical protein
MYQQNQNQNMIDKYLEDENFKKYTKGILQDRSWVGDYEAQAVANLYHR